MKLSWKILLHLSWVLAVLLGAWSVLFYVTLTDEINDETDDMLENRAAGPTPNRTSPGCCGSFSATARDGGTSSR